MNLRAIRARGVNFDWIMWFITRLTALFMYLLVLIAVVGALIMGARTQMSLADLMRWAFTPDVSHVLNTNVPNINAWKTLFWQLMGSLMVVTAGLHGYHGFLNVLDDYIRSAGWRNFLRYLIVALWIVMSAIAVYVIFTS